MKNKQIMIVEDDDTAARKLQHFLELMGYTVTATVSSGEQAILKLEEELPDVILMDIMLEGKIDGIETTEIVKSRFDIPVIYITSHVEKSLFEKACTTNPTGYITKPFKKEEILEMIRTSLRKHRRGEDRRKFERGLKKEIFERKRMQKELQMRVRQQDVIAYLGHKALRGDDDPIDFMNEVAGKVAETLDNEYCQVLKLLPDGINMLLLAGIGWEEGQVGHAIFKTKQNSQAAYTLNTNKPVIVDDLRTETRFSDPHLFKKYHVVGGMSIVIHGHDNPWGVLSTHTIRRKVFSKDDVNFLHYVANLMSSAIARKNAEDTLKESEEKYRKLIETAQDAIICIENRVITIWNKSAEDIFGYSRNEILGKPVETIIPEGDKDEFQKEIKQFFKLSRSVIANKTIEVSGRTKDNTIVPLELSLSYHKSKDKKRTVTAIIRDITNQKKAKEQLIEKSNEVETMNKELRDFVYTVSHDLKEPLFSIDGYVNRLYDTYKDIYDEKGRRFSNRIKANIDLMSKRIHEILEVVKIGMRTYDFQKNSTVTIVNNVLAELEDKLESNNINASVKPDLPTVFCDAERIRDVFHNLVGNAIKFMGEGTHRKITIGCDKEGNYYRFFVEDTGIGIQKEYHENVFNIFTRLKVIEAEGTGVGLVIVKKIVQMHKGRIWIEGPVANGRGTRFCFTLPNLHG